SAPSCLYLSPPPLPTPLFPYTTLFRSCESAHCVHRCPPALCVERHTSRFLPRPAAPTTASAAPSALAPCFFAATAGRRSERSSRDRKSTRLNSSHGSISYAVFCLKKKN